ncbi:hypothetical protein CDAR_26721 [Caerostris darwini]|uniref:Uncharacterized protein n=1 Tax=Caerostris darwini TaxID=1538125 RepID=A0AAV4S2U3_9ARAC|nr:hypothetical protein CDAR_26721 [Caerostris darwini]
MVTPVPLHEDDLDLEMGLVIGSVPGGLVVRIPNFHLGGPRSIPGVGNNKGPDGLVKRLNASRASEEAILVRVNHCGFPTPEVVFLRDSLRTPTPERCFYGRGVTDSN